MKKFMNTLADLVKDKKIKEKVQRGFPTPFEHSLYRWKGWEPLGIKPSLVRMLWNNEFTVKEVEKGSLADSLGIKKGDSLKQIDGYDVDKKKDWAYRSILLKKDKESIQMVFIRNKKKIEITYTPHRWN